MILTATVRNCVAGQPATADRNVRTEYGYDGSGRPIWTRGPTGEVTRTTYEARGLVDKAIAGCSTGGAYSTTTCDPFSAGTPWRNRVAAYGYDDRGRQVTATDPLGVVTRTEYDSASRPFKTTRNYVSGGPANASTNVATTTEYDAAGRVTATLDPLGRKTAYRYDLAGRQFEVIRNYVDGNPATGSADSDLISRTEYDAAGNPTAVIANYVDGAWNPAQPDTDNKTVTVYDALNRPIKVIAHYVDGVSGAGAPDTDLISETVYDAAGNVVATIDPLGRVTVTAYDALNRPTSSTRNCTDGAGAPRTSNCAAGHGAGNDENLVTTTAYTARGLVDYTLDPLGRKTAFVYDGLGRVTAQTANAAGAVAPANVATSYAYDAAGRVLATTDPLGKVWQSAYNGAGWQTTATDPTSRTTTYTYDGLGRRIGVIDPLNHEQRTLYDPLGRVTQGVVNWQNGAVEPADGADRDLVTATEYDAAGRRTALVDAGGRRTSYAYDGLDRLTGVTENAGGTVAPANVTTQYSYDRRGLLVSITDANSHARGRGYNAAGWQVSATDGLNRTTTSAYDRGGRKVSQTDPRPVTVAYAHDLADRLVSTSAPGLTTIALAYDAGGRRASMADGTGTTSYAYDGLDRLLSATHSVTGTVSHGWDPAGRRTSVAVSGGLGSGAPAVGYGYDDAGRLTAVTKGGANYATATYDPAGRLGTVTRYNAGVAGAATTYGYDNADRLAGLTTAQGGTTLGDFGYTYARNGQVTQAVEAIGGTSRTVSYTYDGLLRLTGATSPGGTTYAYGYDPAGNRTSVTVNGGTAQTKTYDAADQVVGWTYDAAGNLLGDGTTSYTYDPLGRLASATVGGATTTYGYDGDNTLALRAAGGSTTRYSIDTQGGLSERLGAVTTGGSTISTWYVRGWGGELGRETGAGTAWYLADRLGSVHAEYGATGTVGVRTIYDPFGQPEGGPGLTSPTDYGFTGEPQEAGSGLVQLRARWYQPASGQFVSRDPFAGQPDIPQTYGPYSYAHNDPINGTDPTGWLRADLPLLEGGFGAIGVMRESRVEGQLGSVVLCSSAGVSAPSDPLAAINLAQADYDPGSGASPDSTLLFAIPLWTDIVKKFLDVALHLPIYTWPAVFCVIARQICVGVIITAIVFGVAALLIYGAITASPTAQNPSGPQPGPAPCPLDANGQPQCDGTASSPGTGDEPQPQATPTPNPPIAPTPGQRPAMRVQLQEQQGSATIHHDSIQLFSPDSNGVITSQAIGALRSLRASTRIPRRQQNAADTALAAAIAWVQARPPLGVSQQNYSWSFYFDPNNRRNSFRFDIENLVGTNLRR